MSLLGPSPAPFAGSRTPFTGRLLARPPGLRMVLGRAPSRAAWGGFQQPVLEEGQTTAHPASAAARCRSSAMAGEGKTSKGQRATVPREGRGRIPAAAGGGTAPTAGAEPGAGGRAGAPVARAALGEGRDAAGALAGERRRVPFKRKYNLQCAARRPIVSISFTTEKTLLAVLYPTNPI